MGKNITIYFDDECIEYIANLEGKGTLINNLLKDHFRNDEDNLMRRLQLVDNEKKEILRKLDEFQTIRARKEIHNAKEREMTEERLAKKTASNMILRLLQKDLITEKQWENCFTNEGIDLIKAKKLIDKSGNVDLKEDEDRLLL